MPTLIIVAGPNGAGKTSFANKHFETPGVNLYYLNADEIARGLVNARLSQGELDIRAGREMLGQIDALVDAGASFMFETTLASLTSPNVSSANGLSRAPIISKNTTNRL